MTELDKIPSAGDPAQKLLISGAGCIRKNLEVIEIRLEIEMTNNNGGSGGKWYPSAKVRKEIEDYLTVSGLVRKPFGFQASIRLTRILGKRQSLWDSDSGLRGNSKELIDALVACGWFVDDGPKYIKETQFRQDATQRKNGPAILLEVFPVGTWI